MAGTDLTTYEYAQLAAACYTRTAAEGMHEWKLTHWYNVTAGNTAMTVASFQSDAHTVLAFAGTDPSNVNHLKADLAIGVGALPAPATKANEILDLLTTVSGARKISIVGHSLGGALAQYVGYWYPIKEGRPQVKYITFCAPGITGNFTFSSKQKEDLYGTNYIVENDQVHKFGGTKTGKVVSLGRSVKSFPECHKMVEVLKLIKKDL